MHTELSIWSCAWRKKRENEKWGYAAALLCILNGPIQTHKNIQIANQHFVPLVFYFCSVVYCVVSFTMNAILAAITLHQELHCILELPWWLNQSDQQHPSLVQMPVCRGSMVFHAGAPDPGVAQWFASHGCPLRCHCLISVGCHQPNWISLLILPRQRLSSKDATFCECPSNRALSGTSSGRGESISTIALPRSSTVAPWYCAVPLTGQTIGRSNN